MKYFYFNFLVVLIYTTTALSASTFSITSGSAQILTNPTEAGTSTGPRSDTVIYAFDEQLNVPISANLSVSEELTMGGETFSWFNRPTSGTISAPATLNSHFFYARASNPSSLRNYEATFEFDNPIVMVGFMSSTGTLNSTPTSLLHPGTTYEYGSLQFSFFCIFSGTCDFVGISVDRKVLTLNFNTTSEIDSLRVITQGNPPPVPEPPAAVLVASMLFATIIFSKQKNSFTSTLIGKKQQLKPKSLSEQG